NFVHIFKQRPLKPAKVVAPVKGNVIKEIDDDTDDDIDEEDIEEEPVKKDNERVIFDNKEKKRGLFSRKPKEEKAKPVVDEIEEDEEFTFQPPKIDDIVAETGRKPVIPLIEEEDTEITIENDESFEEEEYENQPLEDYDPTLD